MELHCSSCIIWSFMRFLLPEQLPWPNYITHFPSLSLHAPSVFSSLITLPCVLFNPIWCWVWSLPLLVGNIGRGPGGLEVITYQEFDLRRVWHWQRWGGGMRQG